MAARSYLAAFEFCQVIFLIRRSPDGTVQIKRVLENTNEVAEYTAAPSALMDLGQMLQELGLMEQIGGKGGQESNDD
jgi:hypothetical protein